jgi:Tfp pilus assembly protein PilP
MRIRAVVAMGAVVALAAGVTAQEPPPIKIGTRVGVEPSGYDPQGRRDPFASLVRESPAATATSDAPRAKGLAGIAVTDVEVTGIITAGEKWLAIVAGPDGTTYLARTNDRLHDATIRRIDRDAVVFLARTRDVTGATVSREVRKALRPTTGGGR